MNKHDDGYVLAYVMVMLVIFCLIATMILTGALTNLHNQQASVTRMQDQYIAAGMIEEAVAQLENGDTTIEEYSDTDGEIVLKKLQVTRIDNTWAFTAQSGSVVIECVVIKEASGCKYQRYEIGGVTDETSP